MSKAEHTPSTCGDCYADIAHTTGEARIWLCPVHAAAPDLLAAAEVTLRSLDLDDDDRLEWTGDQRKILRAAIAKAKGE